VSGQLWRFGAARRKRSAAVSRAARDQPQHTGMPKRFELFQGTTRCEVAAAGLRDTAARRARRDGPRPGWFFLDKIFRGRKVKFVKRKKHSPN
jgi:hypothetical protein